MGMLTLSPRARRHRVAPPLRGGAGPPDLPPPRADPRARDERRRGGPTPRQLGRVQLMMRVWRLEHTTLGQPRDRDCVGGLCELLSQFLDRLVDSRFVNVDPQARSHRDAHGDAAPGLPHKLVDCVVL